MISVQDLCVGNWVYDGERTQFPMFVQAIGEDYVYLNFEGNEGDIWESTPEELQGIPLTEELLKKIGFTFFLCESTGIFSKKEGEYCIKVKPELSQVCIYGFDNHISNKITHLHELQNFVFLATKQQLKVNL